MEYHRVLLGISFIVGSIHHCVTIEDGKKRTLDYDWTNVNGTVILGYQDHVLKEDNLVIAVCNTVSGTRTECSLTMTFPRFNGEYFTCMTVWERRLKEDDLVLPGWLASTGSTIIFPVVYRSGDYDSLQIRTFYMPDCTAKDIVSYGIQKGSQYLVVPFSDSFDVFYRGFGRESEEHKEYRKQAFYENGTPIDNEPIVFFNKISNDSIHKIGNETVKRLMLLNQLRPMSPNNRSLGYVLMYNIRGSNFSSAVHLDGNGEKIGGPIDLPKNLPGLLFTGQHNILAYSREYDYVEIINKDFRKIKDMRLPSWSGSDISEVFIIDSDPVVARCEIEEEPPNKRERHCWLERFLQSGSSEITSTVAEISLERMRDVHSLIPTYASGRICINALSYHVRGVQQMSTSCVDKKF
ncbi:hypothetical protein QAD02_011658 [Eretmocerus hayati]|uniref:Uncharacterized protein n=1 Tax=Eretmocerus hayati TaxID=131215 RepID=A0ACC2NXN3_9HYME|nr:hypothetical protein QAD02_011658 [Eretmocerus hayati]